MNKHPSNVSETASNKPASNATAFVLPGTAVAPYRAFTAALSNGDTCPVHASNGTDWQDFIGTYSAGALAQTTLLESSTGSWIDWSAGADVLLEIAWLGATGEDTDAHLASTSNPHSVTAAQVGAYTSGAVDTLLTGKADTSHNHSGAYEPADTNIQTHITDTALHSVGAQITAATSKATPVDADELGLVDSAASNVLKKLTWANLKATLTSIFAILAGKAGGQTLVGGSAVTDALVLQGTSGNGTAASPAVQLKVGNNGGTTALTVLNSGNVGIGTTSPTAKLDVNGGIGLSGFVTAVPSMAGGFIGSSNGIGPGAYPYDEYGNLIITSRSNGTGRDILFQTGATLTSRMVINRTGNVGIGTTAPSAKLTVNTGNIHYNTTYTDASNYERLAITGTAGSNVQIKAETAGTGADNLSILLTPAGTGNVGIGTTAPSALLDINSDTFRVRTSRTPSSATATGNAGDVCWDANYIYVCTATNTWKRSAISTW